MTRESIRHDLEALEREGLLRRPATVGSPAGPVVEIEGRQAVLFCGNNYLGLADHSLLREAAAKAALEHGVGSGSSRLVSGTTPLHLALEARLARFVGTPAALVFTSGYHANTGAIPALAGPEDAVFSDALNHASIIDGCRLSRARVYVYPHSDPEALTALLRTHRGRRRALVVTEALFSMDGDPAPLRALRAAADRFEALLYVDEAHSLGVVGPGGTGLGAALDVRPDVLVGTLGKAFGVFGAFVAGTDDVRSLLVTKARSFVYTTAPPMPVVAACIASVGLVEEAHDRREALLRHQQRLGSRYAIHPVIVGDPVRTMSVSRALLERGYFVQGIRPPTVPEGTSRLRITLMATHTPEQVDGLVAALHELLA